MKKLILLIVLLSMSSMVLAEDRYILTLGLKQSRISLNLWDHAKDSMNATKFDIPVDKQFFDSVKIGDKLSSKMRTGSVVLYGSFSSWKVWIKNKKVVKKALGKLL